MKMVAEILAGMFIFFLLVVAVSPHARAEESCTFRALGRMIAVEFPTGEQFDTKSIVGTFSSGVTWEGDLKVCQKEPSRVITSISYDAQALFQDATDWDKQRWYSVYDSVDTVEYVPNGSVYLVRSRNTGQEYTISLIRRAPDGAGYDPATIIMFNVAKIMPVDDDPVMIDEGDTAPKEDDDSIDIGEPEEPGTGLGPGPGITAMEVEPEPEPELEPFYGTQFMLDFRE